MKNIYLLICDKMRKLLLSSLIVIVVLQVATGGSWLNQLVDQITPL